MRTAASTPLCASLAALVRCGLRVFAVLERQQRPRRVQVDVGGGGQPESCSFGTWISALPPSAGGPAAVVCVGLVQAFCKVLRWGASVMRKPAFTAAEVSLTPPVWLGRARLIVVRVARVDQDEVDGGPGSVCTYI